MSRAMLRVLSDDGGAAIVEYSLILAGIAVSAIAALQMTGTSLNTLFASTSDQWSSAAHSGQ
jgi:Flp pilus assembly pilin Flp